MDTAVVELLINGHLLYIRRQQHFVSLLWLLLSWQHQLQLHTYVPAIDKQIPPPPLEVRCPSPLEVRCPSPTRGVPEIKDSENTNVSPQLAVFNRHTTTVTNNGRAI